MPRNLNGVLDRTPLYAGGMLRSRGISLGRVPAVAFSLAAQGMDFLVVQAAALIANAVLQHGGNMALVGIFGANAVGFACYFSFRHGGMYKINTMRNEARVFKAIAVRWTTLCLLLALSASLLHHSGERARLWLLLFYGVSLAGFCAERFVLARLVRNWLAQGNHLHSIGVIGGGDLAQHLVKYLAGNTTGLKLAGMFADHVSKDATRARGIPELLELAGRDEIDTVIIADSRMPSDQLRSLLQQLRQQPLSIYWMPGHIALEPPGCAWPEAQVFPGLNLFPLAYRPINEMSLFVKSAFDRLTALLLLLVLGLVMAVCAAGIRLSGPGPILFRQRRIGYKGRAFMIFKFRTMHVSERPNDKLTAKNDPRIFRFGRLLRKTSLDELPQLFNVLRGEMSLVGPRPHMPEATAAGCPYFEVVSNYAERHRVKPGITGWAQVNGWRGPTETIDQIEARVAHDLYYIENWSLPFDLLIIFRTFLVLFGKNVF
jgi:Undecaprenyl-phosphate glucose phosphotransferase